MPRPFVRYVGVDLGGARGKTTAVARLSRRAERTGSTGRAIADEIRLKFDRYLSEGPYFSLARFGEFILIADRDGERIVEAFESSLQREKRARGLRAQGFTVKLTAKQQYSATKDGAAGSFIGDVLEKVDALDMDAEQKGALMDQLNQLAISALPDASYRKHFAHRKGTPGFSNDAMRAFASNCGKSTSFSSRMCSVRSATNSASPS